MFEPVVIRLEIPMEFASEFLRRLPLKFKLGSIYSHTNVVEGNSMEIDLNFSNNINLLFESCGENLVRIKADIFDEEIKSEYIQFLKKIGYVNKDKAKIYEVTPIQK